MFFFIKSLSAPKEIWNISFTVFTFYHNKQFNKGIMCVSRTAIAGVISV